MDRQIAIDRWIDMKAEPEREIGSQQQFMIYAP